MDRCCVHDEGRHAERTQPLASVARAPDRKQGGAGRALTATLHPKMTSRVGNPHLGVDFLVAEGRARDTLIITARAVSLKKLALVPLALLAPSQAMATTYTYVGLVGFSTWKPTA